MSYRVIDKTKRNHRILELLAEGCSQAQIAAMLTAGGEKITQSGVRMNVFRMCQDFGADNSYHLIALSFRRGILK